MGEIVPPIDYSKTYDEDVVTLDETKIVVKRGYKPGIFSSHHVYPYYPDFLRNEEKYSNISFPEGSSYYYNYLKDLKKYYKNMPLLISEFGIPTSRGVARFHPEGLNHGGHNESEQAEFLKKMTFSIEQAGCAGGIIFSWIDEWFKSNWMVKGMEKRGRFWYNAQDPEESYGLMAMRPAGIEKLKGKTSAWKTATKLYSKDSESPLKVLEDGFDGARNIKRIYADFDAGYLYLRIDIDGKVDWGKVAYLVALDTVGSSEGDHRLPFNLDLESPIGFEYIILLHGERSKILIDDRYNRKVFDSNLLRFPGQSGYKNNSNFKSVYNNNGLYTELITTHRRRFSRDGKIFPEGIYNASILKQGSLAYDSNSDFYFSKENKFIEIRIPWNLLNFSDPSKLKIIYSNKEQKITDGLRIMAASYKPRNINNSTSIELQDGANATDIIPRNLTDIRYYRWQGWEFPKYLTGLKKSYYAMKKTYKKIKNPDFKINLPAGFNFISVIESHYKSLGKFTNYLYNIDNSSTTNLYALALTNLVKGLVKNEPFYILEAKYLFSAFYNTSTDSKERYLSKLSMQYAESILTGEYKKAPDTKDILERVTIEKKSPPSGDFQKIIIGKSAIKLKKNAKIKTQVERVTRDWLSVYNIKKPPWAFVKENIVPWHEGARIKEIVAYTDSQVYPVWGTIAKRFGNNWYAQDNDGIFRFMFSEDKVFNYPTNIIVDDKTVIVNDTHGISAIAWDSLGADLAVGCGDNIGKVEAAYYLARKGVNVYMPADRFLHMLIGTETKGKIIGSAPVKNIAGQAVIGDQPISIDVNEPVVVSNAKGGYPLQYYDTPYLYFKELERYIGKTMNIIPVDITVYGKAGKVVDKARKIGGKLIGIRVWGKEEHDSVASWLEEDKSHRAILFHTALYPEGYRLFFEYPQQTSFGDINIEIER
ncbi:MAG: hypothetical protein KAJ59_01995, partial [Thermodesulfovibrionia bacterium]|nr:hypothetical protein [Thermodesulfovibrionia bacterium]